MRIPIILFFMLCCFALCCSGSKTEQKKVEPNSELNNEVMTTVKEEIKNLTFLNLCFAKTEFLELIKNDASFRDAWKEKVANIPTRQKEELSMENQDFGFFSECFLEGDISKYAEQVAFLKQYRPKAVGDNYLSVSDYAYIAAKYRKTSNVAMMYMTIFDLLVLDANNFLNEININPESKSGFQMWLTDIGGEMGIVDFAHSSLEMMERKRDYIVSSLEKIENPLALEALKTLKGAVIRPID